MSQVKQQPEEQRGKGPIKKELVLDSVHNLFFLLKLYLI